MDEKGGSLEAAFSRKRKVEMNQQACDPLPAAKKRPAEVPAGFIQIEEQSSQF